MLQTAQHGTWNAEHGTRNLSNSKPFKLNFLNPLFFFIISLSRKSYTLESALIRLFILLLYSDENKGIRARFRGLMFSTEGEKTKIRVYLKLVDLLIS